MQLTLVRSSELFTQQVAAGIWRFSGAEYVPEDHKVLAPTKAAGVKTEVGRPRLEFLLCSPPC